MQFGVYTFYQTKANMVKRENRILADEVLAFLESSFLLSEDEGRAW